MSFKKTVQDRLQLRNEALEKLRERSMLQVARPQKGKKQQRVESSAEVPAVTPPFALTPPSVKFHPMRLGTANGTAPLHVTPWSIRLATTMLERARDGKVSLCLLWPADIDRAVTLHSIATLSQVLSTHLPGIRTLYYPGTDATWAGLDQITADRRQFADLCRAFFNGMEPKEDSDAIRTVLDICNKADYATSAPLLRIRQLIPAFRFDRSTGKWVGVREAPIDSLIKRIPKLALRQQLRDKLSSSNWNNPARSPGALLVLHREIKKKDLKAALNNGGHGAAMPFDVVLMDASTRAILADPGSVKAIPKHLQAINEVRGRKIGTLIVTNDPTEFRVLGKALEKVGLQVEREILAAEASGVDWLASSQELASDWKPDPRGMVNFKVKATDEQAARLARQIRKIVDAVREEGPDVEEPFLRALHLVLRTSLVPGGISDAKASDDGGWSPLTHQLDVNRIEGLIKEVWAKGGATTQRKQIEDALTSMHKHLADCADTTPLAEQLKEAIKRYVIKDKEEMTIVIFSPRDIAIAQHFLARTLGAQWTSVQGSVQWLSLTEAMTKLPDRLTNYRLTIVGLNPRILRFLATQKNVPLHTTLLVPTHQVVRMLPQIQFLSTVEVLKAYRGRLFELASRLESCLGNVADVDLLARVYDTRLPASAHLPTGNGSVQDPAAYRFYLDDGRHVTASGNVFRYDGLDGADFHRVPVGEIAEGDLIFDMSDELRDEVEAAFNTQFTGFKFTTSRSPLDAYRAILKQAIELKCPGMAVADQIPELRSAMVAISSTCSSVSDYKLRYWLTLPAQGQDSAPHAARDRTEYLTFCKALYIAEPLAEQFWEIIRKVRVDNQLGGRQMTSLYAELLLNPESTRIYRGIQPETIQMLQSKALDCVSRVVSVEPPFGVQKS